MMINQTADQQSAGDYYYNDNFTSSASVLSSPPDAVGGVGVSGEVDEIDVVYTSDYQYDYMWLSPLQYYTSVLIGALGSTLSIVGSCIIIYLVFQRKGVTRDVEQIYHRIILGLSIMDIIVSVGSLLSPFLIRNDVNLPLGIGNARTCEMTGFFITFFVGSCLYNSCLSLYYVLTIKFGISNYTLSRKYEPWIHIILFIIPLAFSIAGIVTDAFNPNVVLGVCLTVPYPWNCPWMQHSEEVEQRIQCQRGTRGGPVGAYHLYLTMLGTCISVVCTVIVYWTVQRTTARWATQSEQQSKRRKQVAVQSLCYMLAYLNGLIWAILNSVVGGIHVSGQLSIEELKGNTTLYISSVLMIFFFPLQGFFNCLVYIRPRLLRWKEYGGRSTNNSNNATSSGNGSVSVSWLWAFRQVLSGKPAPTTSTRQRYQQQQPHNAVSNGSSSANNNNPSTFSSSSNNNNVNTNETPAAAVAVQPPPPSPMKRFLRIISLTPPSSTDQVQPQSLPTAPIPRTTSSPPRQQQSLVLSKSSNPDSSHAVRDSSSNVTTMDCTNNSQEEPPPNSTSSLECQHQQQQQQQQHLEEEEGDADDIIAKDTTPSQSQLQSTILPGPAAAVLVPNNNSNDSSFLRRKQQQRSSSKKLVKKRQSRRESIEKFIGGDDNNIVGDIVDGDNKNATDSSLLRRKQQRSSSKKLLKKRQSRRESIEKYIGK